MRNMHVELNSNWKKRMRIIYSIASNVKVIRDTIIMPLRIDCNYSGTKGQRDKGAEGQRGLAICFISLCASSLS
jgi:hypothetical protein